MVPEARPDRSCCHSAHNPISLKKLATSYLRRLKVSSGICRGWEAIDSQNVDAPDSPRNSMPSTDATEDSDDYKDDQSPATFSPNCPF
ncbi:hypothetical protein MSAN_02160000 [Mycena sanguinolenta]|uniref:Uncharacterized protein n=1 Tax=Mycena sanguinolenta TaxID=230812 RepID=A0A8H6XF98_9AGAR|nr:hypothetical protein MSAN_02160000 [Mycena sanguinolenta]